MKTIDEQLEHIQTHKKIGLMTHVVAGYPSLQTSKELIIKMAASGVDFIEIQIPFSDPLADGPVIMMANDRALQQQVTLESVFQLITSVRKQVTIPLFLMGYYNSVFYYGVQQFCERAKEVGAAGVIIPDIPLDEESSEHFLRECSGAALAAIRVISPTSTDERIQLNAGVASGFMYCTASSGTTGVKQELSGDTVRFLTRVRKKTKLPLAVGFGISQPEHVRALTGHATIAVVGSAVIKAIEEKGIEAGMELVRRLVAATR